METSGCDLDLRLGLGDDGSRPINSGPEEEEQQQQQQRMTVFYRGRICVCDATEIKARAIISMARREMAERVMKKRKKTAEDEEEEDLPPLPEKVLVNPELPMKRSLQRFLQKRKSRLMTDAASHPYSSAAAAADHKSPVLELVL